MLKPDQFNEDGKIKSEEMTKELLKNILKPKYKTVVRLKEGLSA